MLHILSLTLLASFTPQTASAHSARVSSVTADSVPFDTTQVVVTTQDFAQLLTFLKATADQWSKPAVNELMKRHVIRYPMGELGKVEGVALPPGFTTEPVRIPNYATIADSVPAIAAGFAAAKLAGHRYLQLSRTLNAAWITDQLDRMARNGTGSTPDTNTVVGKNVAFIRAHRAEFEQLVSLALDVTTFRAPVPQVQPPPLNP